FWTDNLTGSISPPCGGFPSLDLRLPMTHANIPLWSILQVSRASSTKHAMTVFKSGLQILEENHGLSGPHGDLCLGMIPLARCLLFSRMTQPIHGRAASTPGHQRFPPNLDESPQSEHPSLSAHPTARLNPCQ